jgi:N-acetylmuramoyl-L-alanine amidase
MSWRPIGWGLALCFVALLPAPVCRAQADPVRLAALALPDDGVPGGEPVDAALDCLALNVYWEARAEPRIGQIAVAEVTLNRVAAPAFPDTVCGVVRQGEERGLNLCQFSWHCDGVDDRPLNQAAWEGARRLALLGLEGRLPDPTDGALWFHSDRVHPDWPELEPIIKIGSHIFYRTAPGEARALAERRPPLPPLEKPAPPVRLAAAEAIPAQGPARPGPGEDPAPVIGHLDGCAQGLMPALASASEADFLAAVDRMRREQVSAQIACAGDRSGGEQAIELTPAPTGAGPIVPGRTRTALGNAGGAPRLVGLSSGWDGPPLSLDRTMPASRF